MFSFDIFETVLLRDVLAPTDLFYRVGAKAFGLAEAKNSVSLPDFVNFRIKAEQAAKIDSLTEEATLEEIWRILVAFLGWDWTPQWMELEMEVEAMSLLPVEATRQRIHDARSADGKVLYISDHYLPASFLKTQLQRFDLFHDNDRLYVSSEVGQTKATGNLFRHVLAQEGLTPSQLHHYGDNSHSDIQMAQRMGIQATHCDVPQLTQNEMAILETSVLNSPGLRDIVGASRQFRRTTKAVQEEGLRELTGSFLGPFCTIFASWALQSAQKQGLKRLNFCARDCQLVWTAAKILAPLYGDIECRYLYVSRQALLLPSITSCSREEMPWLWRSFEKPLLERTLAKLGLRPADVPTDLGTKSQEGVLLGDKDQERLWETLECSPLKEKVEEIARNRRQAAIDYFSQEGLFDQDQVGIVDLGWSLSCQSSLRKILQTAGFSGVLHGFYLGLNVNRRPPTASGPASAIFQEAPSDVDRFMPVFHPNQYATLLEHLVGQATHPSTIQYSPAPQAGPVFQNVASDAVTEKRICSLHQEVANYATLQRTNLLTNPLAMPDIPGALHAVIVGFFEKAGREAVLSLKHILVTRDQNNAGSRSLLRPLSWNDIVQESIPGRFAKAGDERDDTWMQAARFTSSPAIYRTFHCLRHTKRLLKQKRRR